MRAWCWLLFPLAACLAAQAPEASPGLSPELLQLARVKVHMGENLVRQPNYTCLETVERTRRSGRTRRFELQDTLRLEVALVEGQEMFAWPGSKKFEETDIRRLITRGTFGNGNFALHARGVFLSNAPTFEYRGEQSMRGRRTVRYDFRVPLLQSGYRLRVNEREALVGYHGSFYSDAETLDVLRLEIAADDIPASLGLISATERMDYARIAIGSQDFLLPAESELTLVDPTGLESRNHVRFTACRQFAGESVLTFNDPDFADARVSAAPPEEIAQPADLSVSLALLQDIDPYTAAGGDAVRAELRSDLKSNGQVLMPKGAVAEGRITRVEIYSDHIVLGLTFTDLNAPGRHMRLHVKLSRVLGIDMIAPRAPVRMMHMSEPDEGLITLQRGRVRLTRGILMYWGI
jgi:hypothetical protein